jgi:3-oxoacyl-[acyl-carrier-protein] synthase II
VLERWDLAEQRGACILAEWIDGRLGSDPSGLTGVDPSGEALNHLMETLLAENGLAPSDLGFVNVHGTATRQNDQAEAAALQRLLGRGSPVPLVGIKGALGHLMGAAGAVETAACVLSLASKIIPPTVNYFTADPNCPGDVNTKVLRRPDLNCCLKISLGFGGPMAVALLKSV